MVLIVQDLLHFTWGGIINSWRNIIYLQYKAFLLAYDLVELGTFTKGSLSYTVYTPEPETWSVSSRGLCLIMIACSLYLLPLPGKCRTKVLYSSCPMLDWLMAEFTRGLDENKLVIANWIFHLLLLFTLTSHTIIHCSLLMSLSFFSSFMQVHFRLTKWAKYQHCTHVWEGAVSSTGQIDTLLLHLLFIIAFQHGHYLSAWSLSRRIVAIMGEMV